MKRVSLQMARTSLDVQRYTATTTNT